MTYLAVDLINRSWYLSSIISRDLQTVPGSYTTEGLFLLNTLLDFAATDIEVIPYFTRYTFDMVAGQEMYFIPGLVDIELLTFDLNTVRFPMSQQQRVQYFGTGRVENIQSLPVTWHVERVTGGSNLYVYFLPNQAYTASLSGKFALTDVTLTTDMSTVYDPFYLEYLRYSLASFMCDEWDVEFAPDKKKRLMTYRQKLAYVSPPDLTIQKIGYINTQKNLNWAHVNISPGYTP